MFRFEIITLDKIHKILLQTNLKFIFFKKLILK
jgi:hypothetical protein